MRAKIPSLMLASYLTLGCIVAQTPHWIADGNRALYAGHPAEAATAFQAALDAVSGSNISPQKLVHLHVVLATAHLEAGNLRTAERVLGLAEKVSAQSGDDLTRAEVLNGWSVLHMLQGKLDVTESELRQARSLMKEAAQPGDLRPAVLHNLAAVEMRTGEYAEALNDEEAAMALWSKMLDPDHPHFIRAWASLGSLQYLLNRPKDAEASMARAVASARKTYGPTYPLVADLLESQALIFDRLKRKSDAKQARAEAREIRGGKPPAEAERLTWNVKEALAPDSAVYLRAR